MVIFSVKSLPDDCAAQGFHAILTLPACPKQGFSGVADSKLRGETGFSGNGKLMEISQGYTVPIADGSARPQMRAQKNFSGTMGISGGLNGGTEDCGGKY